MYDCIINEMTNAIENSNKTVKEALIDYWEDKIAAIWDIEDVIMTAEQDFEIKISNSAAREILYDILENMDANYGITWETIRCHVSDYIETMRINHG